MGGGARRSLLAVAEPLRGGLPRSPVALDVDLARGARRMEAEPLALEQDRHVVDHRRIAAEEHVGVRRRRPEAPRLLERPAAPQVLHVTDRPRPRLALLLRTAHDAEDGELGGLALHREELAGVAEVPRVTGAEEERDPAPGAAEELRPEHAHVRREPG